MFICLIFSHCLFFFSILMQKITSWSFIIHFLAFFYPSIDEWRSICQLNYLWFVLIIFFTFMNLHPTFRFIFFFSFLTYLLILVFLEVYWWADTKNSCHEAFCEGGCYNRYVRILYTPPIPFYFFSSCYIKCVYFDVKVQCCYRKGFFSYLPLSCWLYCQKKGKKSLNTFLII